MASSGEGAATTSAAGACATGDINVDDVVVAEEVGAAVVAPSSEPNASDKDITSTLAVTEKQGAQKPQAPVRPSSPMRPNSPRSSAESEGGAVATTDGTRAQIDTTPTYIPHHHHHNHQHPALLHTFPYSHQCNTQHDPQHDPQSNQPLPCPPIPSDTGATSASSAGDTKGAPSNQDDSESRSAYLLPPMGKQPMSPPSSEVGFFDG